MAANPHLDVLRTMLDMSMRQAALGAAIKRAREEKNWKQRQLAAQIPGQDGPINTQTVSNWERGVHAPDIDTLELIAQALGKPMSYFVVTPDDEPELPPSLQEELAASVHQLAEVAPRLATVADRLEELLDAQLEAQASRKPK